MRVTYLLATGWPIATAATRPSQRPSFNATQPTGGLGLEPRPVDAFLDAGASRSNATPTPRELGPTPPARRRLGEPVEAAAPYQSPHRPLPARRVRVPGSYSARAYVGVYRVCPDDEPCQSDARLYLRAPFSRTLLGEDQGREVFNRAGAVIRYQFFQRGYEIGDILATDPWWETLLLGEGLPEDVAPQGIYASRDRRYFRFNLELGSTGLDP